MQTWTAQPSSDLPSRRKAALRRRDPARKRQRAATEPRPGDDPTTVRLRSAARNAFAMAALMEVSRPTRLRAAVLHRDGEVLALQVLASMEQALLVRDMLVPLGFREIPPTPELRAYGCRMALQWSEEEGWLRGLLRGGSPVPWLPRE